MIQLRLPFLPLMFCQLVPPFSLLYQSLSLLKQQVFLLKNLFLRKPPIAKSSGIPNPMIFTVVPMIILPNPRKYVFPLAPGPREVLNLWISDLIPETAHLILDEEPAKES